MISVGNVYVECDSDCLSKKRTKPDGQRRTACRLLRVRDGGSVDEGEGTGKGVVEDSTRLTGMDWISDSGGLRLRTPGGRLTSPWRSAWLVWSRGTLEDSDKQVLTIGALRSTLGEWWSGLGIAYRAPLVDVDRVIAHLNNREKRGYEKFQALFHPLQAGMSPFNVDIYVGRHDNPFFVLNEDLEITAERIATAKGPSGTNAEYFFQLMASLRNLDQSHKDLYLEALEAAIIKMQLAKSPPHEGLWNTRNFCPSDELLF
ncbi:unnamed protein product [Cyprideis torosa]|uniref:glutathione-specific gamma-glutamylcyclotransferase n=1 Tax=Cyprideis torosa TaxID=163714 RepID=A0A7R8WD62_9CRUS|nr:unnamed protein product [Cyprideis torosa]CAG0888651.1 unnamed protein product [Cyprideis torosa]